MDSVCCAVWKSTNKIFPVKPGVFGLSKTFTHCSLIHYFVVAQGLLLEFHNNLHIATTYLLYLDVFTFSKIKSDGNTLLSTNIVNWAVHCLLSRAELFVAHQTSSVPVLSQVLLSSITNGRGVWSMST